MSSMTKVEFRAAYDRQSRDAMDWANEVFGVSSPEQIDATDRHEYLSAMQTMPKPDDLEPQSAQAPATNLAQPVEAPSVATLPDNSSDDVWNQPDPALALIDNGYEPVVVDGKRPVADGWQIGPVTAERIRAERADYPNATNTGLCTGHLVGIDIDLRDAGHAERMRVLASEILGPSTYTRVGSKGCMICYKNETSIKKITISADGVGKPKVEILGTGQQFVAYGIHPDTGKPYEWIGAAWGAEPLQAPLGDLPEVTPEKLREFAKRAAAALTNLGYVEVKVTGDIGERVEEPTPSAASGDPLSPVELEGMLLCIPPSLPRTDWLRVIGATRAVPCTDPDYDALELLQRWSKGDLHEGRVPENYEDEDDVAEAFYSMAPNKVGGVGPGTLIHMARAHGYRGSIGGKPASEVFSDAVAKWPANDQRLIVVGETDAVSDVVLHGEISDAPPGSEIDLTAGFVQLYGRRLRYVPERSTWLTYTGRRWEELPTPAVWNLVTKAVTSYARV